MAPAADVRPDPTFQRKAAIAHGGALDHTGRVHVRPMPDLDLDRTIFQTLEGRIPRFVMKTRVGKEVRWDPDAAEAVQADYARARATTPLPAVPPALLRFLVEECDFDVEHADGSFLDHLYFCFEYTVAHDPEGEPLVALLHSVLGTGTNTFAMDAAKIPQLRSLLSDEVWTHVQAFPSLLRLLYHGPLRAELRRNLHRADALSGLDCHRVIDNAPLHLTGEQVWRALNYQLVHLVDFLPVSNWHSHRADPAFVLFRDLHDLLTVAGRLRARVGYVPAAGGRLIGEELTLGGRLITLMPSGLAERLASRSVARFSSRIGHDLGYRLHWDG